MADSLVAKRTPTQAHEKVVRKRGVRLLLDHGADPKLTDGGGRPTTEYAQGAAAMLELLQRKP